jgi:hypothetical protein
MSDSEHQSPVPEPRDALQFGRLRNSDANFRRLSLWLARDPLYGKVPFARLARLHEWISSGCVIIANVDGELVGACAWIALETTVARRAIAELKAPKRSDQPPTGDEILLTMIAGSRPGMVKKLIRHVMSVHHGRIILYERHLSRGSTVKKFGWIDRDGIAQGSRL